MNTRIREKGIAAIEVVFSLPVILMCVGVVVYVGTMMRARQELLTAVQEVTMVCSTGVNAAQAVACVTRKAADVAGELERCNNLTMESQTRDFSNQPYDALNGQDDQLVERAVVRLTTLDVTARCNVPVRFPLQFIEFNVFTFELSEQAASPLRLERVTVP